MVTSSSTAAEQSPLDAIRAGAPSRTPEPVGRGPAGWRFFAGPAVGGLFFALAAMAGLPVAACWTAALTGLCAAWWVLEPIPIPATSLIPFAALPMLGILDHKTVAGAYGHTLILLLFGGFVLSQAMEGTGAHRRLALGMVRVVGTASPKRLVLGFMIATACCSMWISNTATVLMMVPVALAALGEDPDDRIAAPLLLGLAYSASIGGMGTPVGTPPNVIFMGVYAEVTGRQIGFLDWMRIGIPAVLVLLPIAWLLLTRGLTACRPFILPALGSWRPAERRVLIVLALTAAAWITRTAPFGGWSALLGTPGAGDSTVALLAVVMMFLVPDGEGDRLLSWERAARIPWGLLILFGGGIALARAFDASGLSTAIGSVLASAGAWPALLLVLAICLGVTFLTEVTSNTATTTLLMPVLGAAAVTAKLPPELLMIPAALAASCAFMLPVATAPNAVVLGSGRVTPTRMAREGLALNLVSAVALSVVVYLLLGDRGL